MACCSPCGEAYPKPCVNSYIDACSTGCGGSRVLIYPAPSMVTFGPATLTSFSQNAVVGTSGGPGLGGSSGYGGFGGYGGYGGYGCGRGYGGGSCGPC